VVAAAKKKGSLDYLARGGRERVERGATLGAAENPELS
jgi:hypothetical protein